MTQAPSPSLFVIVAGFGNPHIEKKLAILQNNLAIIRNTGAGAAGKLTVRVCIYDTAILPMIPPALLNDPDITWIVRKGIVGEYIKDFAKPADVKGYDYVMMILDDIELQPSFNLGVALAHIRALGFDLVSPSMTLDSKFQYQYMLEVENTNCDIKVVPCCEAFCYIFPHASYLKYYDHVDKQNPWMWGLDLVLKKCIGLSIGILNKMTMRHYYKNESYELRPDANPQNGYNHVIAKYKTSPEELADQKAILYWVLSN